MGQGVHWRAVEARFRNWVLNLPRAQKRVILVLQDMLLLSLALWLAMSVRLNDFYWPDSAILAAMLLAAPVLSAATFGWFGLYRQVTRYLGAGGIGRLIVCHVLAILVWSVAILVTGIGTPYADHGIIPRSVPFAYFIVGVAFIIGSRTAAAWLLRIDTAQVMARRNLLKPVLIFGAGSAGVQLCETLTRTGEARVAGFLDTDPSLWGQYAAGVKIYKPNGEKIARLLERERVRDVILAMPHLTRREQQAIIRDLKATRAKVRILPSIADLASGRITVSDLKPVQVEDLLGRELVPADPALLARNTQGKSVLVTGAGGSIGSELVRQIVQRRPSRLVLFELAEPALYEIEQEVESLLRLLPPASRPELVAVLGSVLDTPLLERTMRRHGIETVYHAAAYKHVPIVELNPAAGVHNNVFGTVAAAEAARAVGVERFVLISTDKAVRPTNVMGATKRVAELVLQAHAADPGCRTAFTMVRFGNVLGSSGSVVRRFRQQIEAGGPITVTHPDVTRYFMSIPEAAELVIQAGAMAEGGDVFILEMGEPVKIDDLARTMVRLAGLSCRDDASPDGDIAIQYTGLRPGEKLYEELLIGDGATGTAHPRILRNNEPFLTMAELTPHLDVLRAAVTDGDGRAIEAVLMRIVEGYSPSPGGDPTGRIIAAPAPSRMLH